MITAIVLIHADGNDIPGIAKTTALMACECYSKADLGRMWAIGFNGEHPPLS